MSVIFSFKPGSNNPFSISQIPTQERAAAYAASDAAQHAAKV
jgi:hypothetical protein